jgi:ribosomal protein L16/L10AE
MLRRSLVVPAWHYVHPKTGRPIKQTRRYGDPRYINNEAALIEGQWGLITSDFGMISATQLENCRLAILRRMPRNAFTLVMHTDYEEFPVVRKSPEARMGGGKANIHHFGYKFTTGIPLFEIAATGTQKLHQSEAEGIFMGGRIYLPIDTIVVPQGRVDEYTVFK